MRKQILAGLAAAAMLAGGVAFTTGGTATADDAAETHKVWVCKYVGTPGVDEALKSGKNPIEVDGNATAGTWFNDAQGRSYVVGAFESDPGIGSCPPADPGPEWTPPEYPPFEPEPCVEYRFEKSTSTWSAATSTWSAWADWPGAGPLAWGVVPNPRTGHHFGTHGVDGDREYAYVVVDQRPITSGDCGPQPPTWTPPEYPPFEPQPCVEYRLEKSTSTWSAATGTWSAWADWSGAGPLDWGAVPDPRTGHHGGTHGADGDRHFAYVVVDQRPVTSGDCRPPQPPDEVERVHTCDEPGVVYVTTTPYVWDEKTSTWVPGTPVVTTESATDEQIDSCTPEPKVTVTEWADEEIVCDATTVTQTRTVTTTPYVWDPATSTFVLDEANATTVTETRTRDLDPDEFVPCPTEPSTSTTTTTTTTTQPATTTTDNQQSGGPTTTAAPPGPPTPSTPATGLPATGSSSTGQTVLLALLVTALGGVAVIAARRRNATG